MHTRQKWLTCVCAALLAACGGESGGSPPTPGPSVPTPNPAPAPTPTAQTVEFSFQTDTDGWQPYISDYDVGFEESLEFEWRVERLPPNLEDWSGLYLTARNTPDDIFMYISRQVDGLAPRTRYRIEIEITFATNAPEDCGGAGGAPGGSVYVKAGAAGQEPDDILIDDDKFVTTNFDKGRQSESGNDVLLIGDFSQVGDATCSTDPPNPWELKTLSTEGMGPIVETDGSGRLWLIIGTDSGFEGINRVYYLEGTADLTPA